MQKLKSFSLSWLLAVFKCCLIGLVVNIVGVIILAFLMKFVDLNGGFINYINNIIKGVSIFIVAVCLKRTSGEQLLPKLVVAGVAYSLLTFVVFSIMNGNFMLDMSLLFNILFSVIVAVVSGVILNLTRKNV